MSEKHLERYIRGFVGRHNVREQDAIEQMAGVVSGMVGGGVRYCELVADNGFDSGVRA